LKVDRQNRTDPEATEFLSSQYALDGGDEDADGDVSQETIVNPVSGKSDYLLEILHSGDSVPC
jgi:hypothetical protein